MNECMPCFSSNRPLEELKISLRAELDPARFPALLNSTGDIFYNFRPMRYFIKDVRYEGQGQRKR